MKNVMVLMHDDAGQEARFRAALGLTRALGGHLTCIDVVITPTFVGDYADVGGAALLMDNEQRREDQNRARMEARLKAENVAYTWYEECGFLSPCVRDAAEKADIIVLNRELDQAGSPDMLEIIGEAVVGAHKPILAVPASALHFDVSGSAIVAWDGSNESQAALRAAVPLLAHARSVTILEVDDGSIKQPASEAATVLARAGIAATIEHAGRGMERPSTVILQAIDALGAAYLVMGGFGHNRFVEAVFGGVTRRMLRDCPVPVFLAH
ncbi:MAG: universal stress protein [Pseudomonadota bacterium]